MSTGSQRADANDRSRCTPCRGTGKLISGLGGTPHEVTCPWCGGSGSFAPGRDAQVGEPADGQAGQDGREAARPRVHTD